MPGINSRKAAKTKETYTMLDALEPEREQLAALDQNRDTIRRSLEKKIEGIQTNCSHPFVVEGYSRGSEPFEEAKYRCCLACGTTERVDAHYTYTSPNVHTPHYTFEKIANPRTCVSVDTNTYTRASRFAPLSATELRSLSRLKFESRHKLEVLLEQKAHR